MAAPSAETTSAKTKPAPSGLTADSWSMIDFDPYGIYYIKVAIEERKEISEDHFVFAMDTVNEPRSFRSRIYGLTPDFYGLTSEGLFCKNIGGREESGCCNHESGDFSISNWSDEIPINVENHWARVDNDYGILSLEFVMKSTDAGDGPLDPCGDYNGADTATIPNPVRKTAEFVYPIPEGDKGKKQLRKKKVRVIWKKSM
ncbi:MAG: hypothetical protein RRA94_01045 [Bacteroidota bacterium]|nr:hypothetical protein [Bacteroidota bacterium]